MEKNFGQKKFVQKSLDELPHPKPLSCKERGVIINPSPHRRRLDEVYKYLFLFLFVSLSLSAQKLETEKGEIVKIDYRNSIIIFFDPECPICQKYTKNLKEIREKYASNGIKTYLVYPFKILPQQSLDEFKAEYQFDFEIYFDKQRKLMKKLKATTSPEAFLIDKKGKTLYHGAIDNWFYGLGKNRAKPTLFYLIDAIESYLKNEPIKITYEEPIGCLL